MVKNKVAANKNCHLSYLIHIQRKVDYASLEATLARNCKILNCGFFQPPSYVVLQTLIRKMSAVLKAVYKKSIPSHRVMKENPKKRLIIPPNSATYK